MGTTTTTDATLRARSYLADLYDAFSTGDAAAWADHLHADPVVIGTDPDEYWDDPEHLVEIVRAQAAAMAEAGMELRAGTPAIAGAGNVAWIADQPTMVWPDGRRIAMRLTATLVDVEGELRLAHAHLSVGHPNAELLDLALPV